jgi:type IV pilus assembly protein PilX
MSVSRRSQQGAALVVGLLLLVIITLLAIAGMNTASTELIMAGNEQFREAAAQAAEAGIEREIVNLRDVSPNGAPITREAAFGANARSSTTITYRGEGGAQGMSSSFVAFHYDVTSVGTSSRNATVTQVQGAYYTNQMGTDGTMLPLPGTTGAITVD